MSQTLADFGLIRKSIPGYEKRHGQLKMAQAVEEALAERHHLAVEAPCGIGKSFAYLVPAIRHALATKTRVVVVTANIALQEQLIEKDLPLLAQSLPEHFSYALIKGINNYLCRDRYEETKESAAQLFLDGAESEQWDALHNWAAQTKTGDPSELDLLPDPLIWSKVNGVSELCNGAQCHWFDRCHAMNARRHLSDVQVIVTNYHLYFAHLAVRMSAERDVILPAHKAVICDEAHEMADIARDFLGRRLTPHSANYLLAGAHRMGLRAQADRVRDAAKDYFDEVRGFRTSGRYEVRLRNAEFANGARLEDAISTYREEVVGMIRSASDEEAVDRLKKAAGAADRYLGTLGTFRTLDDPNMVYYIDGDGRLISRLIDVSAILREQLFEQVETVVMTSATLATASSFAFHKRETGCEEARELVVPSPFNFKKQAILIVPEMKCTPNDAGFAGEVSDHLNRIIRFLGGRTMALFTSYRVMESCAEAARETGVAILKQGERPRTKLLKDFREDRGTALFAVSSFWQGVDVPGDALSCLTIDKIPFITPEDPLLDALQERDPDTFSNYQVPKATLSLRQGFGRLIRTSTDRGVVVIFDKRLFTKRYGAEMRAALPPVKVVRDLDRLETFFEKRGS
jgi:ATP-dependent DNA helicase DinG